MDVPLREYFDLKIASLNEKEQLRAQLTSLALDKAETAMSARLTSMNEFRDSLKDQASRMATRDELERVENAINELRTLQSNWDARAAMIAFIMSGIMSAISALVTWWVMRS